MRCAVLAAMALWSYSASAEIKSLGVDLEWRTLKPTPGFELLKRAADLPNGTLVNQVMPDGEVWMTVSLDDRTRCQASAKKGTELFLTCGTATLYYSVLARPGRATLVFLMSDTP